MEFFRIQRIIPFMKYSKILNAISFISFGIAVLLLIFRGLAFSIEFTGGLVMEVNFPSAVEVQELRNQLETAIGGEIQIVNFGTARDIEIRLPLKEGKTSAQMSEEVMQAIHKDAPEAQLRRTEFVGPQVGEELATDGFTALVLVIIGIMIYLAFRFEWKFAVAAIIANMHDCTLVIGIFSLFQWEFSLPVLAAVLAVLGYSVNESVIIFDRCRECFRKMRKGTPVEIVNTAITQTISRTVITHSSTLMVTLAMFFFGGPALHYFALALTIGILLGVYSSVFVSAAIALYLGVKREDLVKKVRRDEISDMVP
ncbi:MAG: protein translocase subunit SecF [Burkholderiales bacterium]|nr:protein translocase subunit SecF [Burkholderiales bacterium]